MFTVLCLPNLTGTYTTAKPVWSTMMIALACGVWLLVSSDIVAAVPL
jgi:hypothetical protein